MMRRLTIIPNEELMDAKIYDENLGQNKRHGDGIRDFCLKNKIESDINTSNAHQWSIFLAKLGCLIIQSDSRSIIYIPEIISERQYTWFQKHKKRYKNQQMHAISFYIRDNEFQQLYIDEEDSTINWELICEEIEEKHIRKKEEKRRSKVLCMKN